MTGENKNSGWQEKVVGHGEVPWFEGAPTTVELTITGAPGGDEVSKWSFAQGRLSRGGDAVDLAATIGWKDAEAVGRGELPPAVAYMQGKLKPSGDMKRVVALLESLSSREFDSWLRALLP